jgi:hypothetical protein
MLNLFLRLRRAHRGVATADCDAEMMVAGTALLVLGLALLL